MSVIVTFKESGREVKTDEKEGRVYKRLLGDQVELAYLIEDFD